MGRARVGRWVLVVALAACESDDDGTGGEGSGSGSAASTASQTSSMNGDCEGCENPEHICCDGACVDPRNDAGNCGDCGNACTDEPAYCSNGACAVPACEAQCDASEVCCGAECCGAGMICCDLLGPVGTPLPSCITPDETGACPAGCAPLCKCAAPDTPIDTPEGPRPIASLSPGDLVYSIDAGRRVVVPILATQRIPAPSHHVVRLRLDDGLVLEISGAHPLGDGRPLFDLHPGEHLGPHRITELSVEPYHHPYTHDILPASPTAVYLVNGIAVASTMQR